MAEQHPKITGLVLAGGMARRMGGRDKGLIEFRGRPLVLHAIAALTPVVDGVVINANRNLDAYREFGFPVIEDATRDFDGPLAGLASAMDNSAGGFVLTVPCDCPMLDSAALTRMVAAVADGGSDCAVASDGDRLQPVVLIAHTRLYNSLQTYLDDGQRKIDRWLLQHDPVIVDYSDREEIFCNVNTPGELQRLQQAQQQQ